MVSDKDQSKPHQSTSCRQFLAVSREGWGILKQCSSSTVFLYVRPWRTEHASAFPLPPVPRARSLSLSLSLLLPNINVNTVILGNESNTKNKQTNTQIKIGQPTGMFAADEHLGGRNPSRGTELCTIVEVMYSLGLLHQIEGTKP